MSRVIFGLVALIATILITNINAQTYSCGPNEVWKSCASPCIPTCGTGICQGMCRPGCACIDGYTRSEIGGPCHICPS